MGCIWTLENRYRKFLDIELAVCFALAEKGIIPREAAETIARKAVFSVERIAQIEEITRHDVVAFTRCVAESLGEESRYFHYGLTSYDVVDTALSLLLQEACSLLEKGLAQLSASLRTQALRYRDTVMIGRTHGIHAEPITLGLKFALWWDETRRHQRRLQGAREAISYGKISGAVGTYAFLDPWIEDEVCRRLGLKAASISTQILQRDGHAELIMVLAIIATFIEKIAVEIRGLQKTEVREVEEPFYQGQKGSSAMPHKRNPVSCEQLCGLARLVRAHSQVALENIPLWHERDISHSSAERVIFPDATILVDYMLNQANRIISGLHVYPEQMQKNMELTGGLIYSQGVLLALVGKGVSREEAYDLVQRLAMRSWEEKLPLQELLAQEEKVSKLLSPQELAACFTPQYSLRFVPYIFERLGINEAEK